MEFMSSSIFKAAVEGDTNVLDPESEQGGSLLLKTPDQGNNVIHIAVRYGRLNFISKANSLFHDLLEQKNNKGNTPLHEAAALATRKTVQRLLLLLSSSTTSTDTTNINSNSSINNSSDDAPYLWVVNDQGDTPFHVALRSGNVEAAEELFVYVKHHPDILVLETFSHKETPLHLYVRYCAGWNLPEKEEYDDNGNKASRPKFIYQLIEANVLAMFKVDSEGLNPLMRAAQCGRVVLIHGMLLRYPQSMECQDSKGKTFLHHLRLKINVRDRECTLFACKNILQLPGVDILSISRDQDGNTPVHLAILDKDYDLAQLILERYVESQSTARKQLIMNTMNSEGKTVYDLNTSEPGIPSILLNLMEQASRGGIMDEKIYQAAKELDVDVFSYDDDNSSDYGHEDEDEDEDDEDEDGDGDGDDDDDDDDDGGGGGGDDGNDDDDDDDGDTDDDDDNDDKNYNKFLLQDINGKNVVHIALESLQSLSSDDIHNTKYDQFFKEAIETCPKLMYQKDYNHDTPLHIAARFYEGVNLLRQFFNYWYTKKEENDDMLDLEVPPWKVKNLKGNTPLHEAARTCCLFGLLQMADQFLKSTRDLNEAFSEVNNNGETALHLIATFMRKPKSHIERVVIFKFVEACKRAWYMRDIEGLTPILRAVHCGQIWLVTKLVGRYPESKDMRDLKGRNMWHYLCSSTSRLSNGVDYLNSVLKAWEDVSMSSDEPISTKFSQDDDGNTPLHLAIIYQNFEVAQYFMKHIVKVKSSADLIWFVKNKHNKDGKSISDLITSEVGTPEKLKEMLLEKPAHPMAIMGDAFYEAAKEGDIEKLTSLPFGWTRRLRDGSNVIHVALWHHQIPFIAMLLSKHLEHVFTLLYLKDYKGDTPLHLAAQLPATEALSFFELCFNHWTSDDDLQKRPPPWMERNIKGNTFLHEAARFCNYQVIFSGLVDGIDNEDVNDNGETVLHVIARYATNAAKNFLENLSEEMQYVIYLQDLEGFTPVLRAVQCGRLGVARLLIQQCPHSIGIPDKKGRTVLHHLRAMVVDLVDEVRDVLPVWNDFFKYCHLDDLRTVQNEDGNTALHSAIIDGDVNKVKFLMEKCFQSESKRELGIVNNNGQTVFDLVSSQAHVLAMKELLPLVNRSYVKERELMDNVMDDVLYQAAINGDIQIFEPTAKDVSTNDEESRPPICTDAYFCSQTPGGSSIIHIALRHGQKNIVKFIETALEKYPILSMRPDSNGDTPLHLAAKWKTGVSIVISLIEASKILLQTLDESKKAFHVAPWAVKNCKGCFPIHEALQTGNLDAAYALLDCDTEAASRVNDLGDTALHSFAKNGFSVVNDEADKFVKTLLNKINQAAYKRDNEGLTPLLSAARSGRIQVAHAILKYRPQSAYLRDPNGRTFLHLLRFTGEDVDESLGGTFENTGKQLFESPEADAQRLVQDYEGDTALHHAIKTQNSVAAIVLTQRCLDDDERRELGLVNKEGHTIPDLLASHDVPNEIIELIQKKVPKAVYLARSSYGIRKSEMKESANALALVAALLATMTFAAAFQVPGGNGDDGFPILFSKVAFVIFSVANTIAMCSSMLCLFILLWVMGIGKIHGSLKILDISIILLRVSFYLTLLTFTTSVFVVTVEKSLWMGIFVYVLGSLTFLLTFKVSIKTVAKYGGITSTGIKNFINLVKSNYNSESPRELPDVTSANQRTQ